VGFRYVTEIRTSDQTARLFASFVTFLSNKEKLIRSPFQKGKKSLPRPQTGERSSFILNKKSKDQGEDQTLILALFFML